jgi:hypothetical protein
LTFDMALKTGRLFSSLALFIKFPFVNGLTLVKTFLCPVYETEDLIESSSDTAESPSLKKIFTCSKNAFLC